MRPHKERVVVSGIGVAAPSGLGHGALWSAAVERRSFIRPISRFDASPFRCQRAGQLEGFAADAYVDHRVLKQTDRATHLGMAACTMAVEDGGLDLAAVDRTALGMYLSNVFGGMEFAEPELYAQSFLTPSRVSAYQSIAWFYAATQGQWSIANDVRGIAKTVVGDGAGGLQALLLGALAIRRGHGTWMLAGGFEAPLTPYAYAIHESSGRLASIRGGDSEEIYRPLDRRARGLVLAEGACVLLLESLVSARARGAHVYAELAGGAMNIDAASADQDDACAGLVQCLQAALGDGGARPGDVAGALPDGTGVASRDARDVWAMAHVFRDCEEPPPVATPKAMIGHALAAAGPLDAAWAAMMLERGVQVEACAPEEPIDHPRLRFAKGGEPLRGDTILCFGSGWNGINAAIALRHCGA